MPRKPRPYRPKVKGCYECSQRRVSCDRGEPQCQKCTSKGLTCSGLDIRYRFSNGIATRGKWVGKTIQNVYAEREEDKKPRNDSGVRGLNAIQFENVQTAKEPQKTSPKASKDAGFRVLDFGIDNMRAENGMGRVEEEGSVAQRDAHSQTPDLMPSSWEYPWPSDAEAIQGLLATAEGIELPEHSSSDWNATEGLQPPDNEDDVENIYEGQELLCFSDTIMDSPALPSPACQLPFEPLPDNIPSWKRQLFMHYSENIAREMLAIDGVHNGWRHLVLPMAHADEVIMNAVLAVSAFHLSLRDSKRIGSEDSVPTTPRPTTPHGCPSAEVLYARTIQGLQHRRELECSNRAARQSVLLAILVLLIAVMVNGREDFPILFSMLQSALEAVGGEDGVGGGELGEFMIRQIRKLRVYAAPLISEQSGVETLAAQAHWVHIFDCLNHCSQSQPEHAAAVSAITDIVQQAHDIYMRQAISNSSQTPSADTIAASIHGIQRFIETIEAFPRDSPGQHVLIWATFIAGPDCILEEHKAFFENMLLRHYARNGFYNVMKGLQHLRSIWARRCQGDKWTRLLPQAQVFLM